ncbi:MAG: bifunctional diaminohydroxyphosphoribosylaminopyrimidine deaminase/5-amino-6-(5-phosphoribosylamino)uracil reductase RibD [Clostridiales bacterium]|nr:bifunctional diaminohydroxyphosphoribosylaminopyrimidine deaminase/5-amino-6-(5-phosphoribosylamino)uracil reductase RibD [Clostridiales bacterium]
MISKEDEKYMKIALHEAKKGAGSVNPNPMVGAVIVKSGEILGIGYHHAYGMPHAEREAISSVKTPENLAGSTLYVTLEPCCHYGKTPPCTEAIISANINRVVCAMTDPNPVVSGKGINILRNNGIEVEVGLLENEAKEMNKFFITKQLLHRPFVALKIAETMDGKTASASGMSQWITSEASRNHAHILRHKYMGILVGINTVLEDDPTLNCRIENFSGNNPVRIILDANLRIPLECKIVKTADKIKTLVICGKNTLAQRGKKTSGDKVSILSAAGVDVIGIDVNENGFLNLYDVLDYLAKPPYNIDSILVEGGSTVHASFLGHKLADYAYFYIAPKILGGKNALPSIGGSGFPNPNFCPEIKIEGFNSLEKDILISGRIIYPLADLKVNRAGT